MKEHAASVIDEIAGSLDEASLSSENKERMKTIFSMVLQHVVQYAENKIDNSSESDSTMSVEEKEMNATGKDKNRPTKSKGSKMNQNAKWKGFNRCVLK